ncbi:MAG: phospho-sugar mutase [Cyclobacteriaceae bacterium]
MEVKAKSEEWLRSKSLDEASKSAIRNLNEEELTDSFYKNLEFGTGGLRGIMGIGSNRINKYTIGMATQGFANYLLKSAEEIASVAIAHDSRNNSKEFAKITADVFSANGIKVYLFDELRPTPELSFAIRHLKCSGGVVLTASHNPKEYNGYKAYGPDGGQLISPHDKNVMNEVSKISSIDEVKFDSNPELIESIGENVDSKYLQMINQLTLSKKSIENQKDLKIVFSPIHGTGITLIPRALKEMGFTNVHVVDRQSKPDGNFPTVVYPNPEEEEAMSIALEEARSINADLVMATDPDADRVGIAVKNTKGEFQLLNGNQTGALLVFYLLTQNQKAGFKGNEFVAKTIVTTELIREIADGFNINCYDTLTGFKFIAELIGRLEGKEVFIGGGEESYGYMIGDKVRDKDAVASCCVLAEMVAWSAENKKSLFEMLIEINQKYGLYHESLKSITKKGMQGAEEIQEMMKAFRSNPPEKLAGSAITTINDYQKGIKTHLADGTTEKLDFPESNVLQFITEDESKISIRPSGTEPKIKFYFSVKATGGWKDYFEEIESLKNKTHKLLTDLGL